MEKKNTQQGISIYSVLFIVFLVLKLTNLIDWKWIWVLSPLWIWAALYLVGLIVVAILRREPKYRSPKVTYGKPLIWDAKTQTMYVAPAEEVNISENHNYDSDQEAN